MNAGRAILALAIVLLAGCASSPAKWQIGRAHV